MDIVIDKLNDDTRNAYEICCAIVRRSYQITKLNEVRPAESAIKPIPNAINQVISESVTYKLESK